MEIGQVIMKKKEIEKNNKLIAEFMGVKKYGVCEETKTLIPPIQRYKKGKLKGWYIGSLDDHRAKHKVPCIYECDCSMDNADNFFYHSSWDWLMPVVEKIDPTYRLQSLERTYNAVIIAITGKWYNEDKD